MQLFKINIIFGSIKLFFSKFLIGFEQVKCSVSYKSSQISYYCFGKGPEIALCFHGYGEDARSFAFLEKNIESKTCLIAVDLPFHGETEWKEGLNFTIEDLNTIIQLILEEVEKIPKHNSYTLVGYSLGARVALSYYQANPSKVKKIVLLAPDGLKVNFWYWLSTQTFAGNWLFALTMKHPEWFFGLLRLLNKLKLVNSSIFKFVNYYIGDPRIREQLYQRWTGLRKVKPNISRIKVLVREHDTKVRFIYGQHDRIILPGKGEEFCKETSPDCSIKIINAGHQVLQEKYTEEIATALAD